jgi:hypothetical protein
VTRVELDRATQESCGGRGRARIRLRTAETVESAIAKHDAISAPVIRNRRSAAIASTSSSRVRCGIDRGADERSTNPPSPSAR